MYNYKCTIITDISIRKLFHDILITYQDLKLDSLNYHYRFPQKSLLDSFYILGLRTINHESDVEQYGVEELEELLKFYGEEQV